jgi:hypothetical protein
MLIHGVSENRMSNLQKLGISDFVGSTSRAKKEISRPAEDTVIGFMNEFLADKHGRAQKIPNPRSGKEEWHLPVWMNKAFVYKLFVSEWPKDCTGNLLFCIFSISLILAFSSYPTRRTVYLTSH